jgi:hypothetical protein
MQTPDPKTVDPVKAFQMLNDLRNGLGGLIGDKKTDVFNKLVIEKSFPIVVNGKKGTFNMIKDKTMTIQIDGITEDEIKEMIRKIHD